MTIAHRRAADRERQTARLLGTKRVVRARYQSAPDVLPIRLTDGTLIQPECKSGRERVPRLLARWLAQATRYAPGAVPLVVVSDVGGAAVAILPLRDLARLLGLAPERLGGSQLALDLTGGGR